MKGKRFDPDFKKDIVQLHVTGNCACVSLEEALGLHPNMVYKGLQKYTAHPSMKCQT